MESQCQSRKLKFASGEVVFWQRVAEGREREGGQVVYKTSSCKWQKKQRRLGGGRRRLSGQQTVHREADSLRRVTGHGQEK